MNIVAITYYKFSKLFNVLLIMGEKYFQCKKKSEHVKSEINKFSAILMQYALEIERTGKINYVNYDFNVFVEEEDISCK